jgi:two-component sensor histidine kinase
LNATNDSAFRAAPDWAELRVVHKGTFLADTDSLPSKWLTDYLPTEEHPRMMAAIEEAVSNNSLFELEHRVFRNEGSIGWSLTRAAPMLAADGSIREWFGIASNVTGRKKGEQAQSLLAELNHRVKNMLTVILSIAEQTRDDSPSLDAFAETFENRVFALAQAHDALTQTGWKGADLGDLARRATELFSSAQRKSVTISGPTVKLGPNAVTGLSLALHELCTNAVKHGSLSAAAGRVDIVWKIDEPDDIDEKRLVIDWKESGGHPVATPEHRGFGSRLLEENLPSDLNGSAQMSFTPGGLCYRLEAPYKDWVQDD